MFSEKSTSVDPKPPLVLVRWKCNRCRKCGFVEAPAGFEMLEALVTAHGDACDNRRISFQRVPANWCEFVPETEEAGGEDELERARRQRTMPPFIPRTEAPSWTRNN